VEPTRGDSDEKPLAHQHGSERTPTHVAVKPLQRYGLMHQESVESKAYFNCHFVVVIYIFFEIFGSMNFRKEELRKGL
jgi:hypothetical protein